MGYQFNPITGKLDLVGSGGGATTDASLLTSGTLADARLSSNVTLDNINNNFTAGQTISAAANTSALTASYSVTGANTTPLLDLSGTWNTTGIARGILLNVTDTASNAGSLLADFRVSGTSRFSVSKTGSVLVSNGTGTYTSANPFLTLRNASSNSAVFFPGAIDGAVGVSVGGVTRFFFGAGTGAGIEIPSTQSLAFVNPGVSVFSTLVQDSTSPQAIAQRNGTNAQAFRLYNTFTDASNFERGFMRWNSNVLEIGTEAGGTGAVRQVSFTGAIISRFDATSGNALVLGVSNFERFIVEGTPGPNAFVRLPSGGAYTWTSAYAGATRDTALSRNAAGVVEVNNGTAGTFRDLRVRNVIQRSGIATTVTPASNGDLVIEQTSDTSITFKMRGTDGTVRSASLTLS